MQQIPQPPPCAVKLLNWLHPADTLEEVEGDLAELYAFWYGQSGKKQADVCYVLAVLSVLPPFVRKRQPKYVNPQHSFLQPDMLRNYLTIAFRNLTRQKLNSTLNIVGLSLGLACGLFILFHVQHELGYDKGFSHTDRIFRITNENMGEDARRWAATPPPMALMMAEQMPEIERVARFHRPYPDRIFSHTPPGGTPRRFEEANGFFADPAVIDVFDLQFSKGNPKTALQEINSIVLTEAAARKYFGAEDPIGKVLLDELDNRLMTVTGVLNELPFPTHLQFDYLVSMATRYAYSDKEALNDRSWSGFYSYVLLKDPSAKAAVEAKLPEFMVKFYAPTGETREQIFATRKLHLQPITDIHLHSKLEKEMTPNSDITYVYIFSAAALLILLLAAVNFVNISTAQAFKRMKEVGLRKVVGASRGQLICQFTGESLLLTLLASGLALLMFAFAMPFYNALTGKNLRFEQLLTLPNVSLTAALMLLIGLLAGSYPAWFVAGFNTTDSLKGKKHTGSSVNLVRKGLIVFQFTVSVCMIFSTVIIYQQLQYFHTQDVGFDKDQLVAVKMYGGMFDKIEAIMQGVRKNPAVAGFTMTSTLPGDRFSTNRFIPLNQPEKETNFRHLWVNASFVPTFGIHLTQGNNFTNLPLDKTAFILNEAAVKAMQLHSPVGSQFVAVSDTGEVVGIVKDFNFASLHTAVEPLVIVHKPFWTNYMVINVRGNQLPEALQSLESTFTTLSPGSLFSYTFLDEKLDRLYESENRMSRIFGVFAGFAILISCVGLFGLSVYAAEVRTKEVGIRKVLGASVPGVVVLLSKDFLKLVLIAILLAWPLAWWATSRWLAGFAYRIDLSWWVFALSGVLAVLVAFLTVSFQAIKAAMVNPVKSLRNE
jgi:putative ABC transport system permease protein